MGKVTSISLGRCGMYLVLLSMLLAGAALGVSLLLLLPPAESLAAGHVKVLRFGWLVNGSGDVLKDAVVIVEDGRILEVGSRWA